MFFFPLRFELTVVSIIESTTETSKNHNRELLITFELSHKQGALPFHQILNYDRRKLESQIVAYKD